MWLYANIRRQEAILADAEKDRLHLICSFINPAASKVVFKEGAIETVNTGFYEDLKKMDPNIDMDKYRQLME